MAKKSLKQSHGQTAGDPELQKFIHARNALQYAAAYQLGSRLKSRYEQDPGFLAAYGQVCYGVGRIDEAVSAFNVLLRIKPDSYEVLHYLGAIMEEQGHEEQALGLYLAALQHDNTYFILFLQCRVFMRVIRNGIS